VLVAVFMAGVIGLTGAGCSSYGSPSGGNPSTTAPAVAPANGGGGGYGY
jgi:hypothetical protein